MSRYDTCEGAVEALARACDRATGEEYQALLKKRRVNFPAHDIDRRLIDARAARCLENPGRFKVAGQDGLIDIQISAFGIGVESLDRAQVRRSRVVSPVLEFELDVDERNEYGQRRRITSLYKQR
jgi:hypothetical protein